MKKFLTVLLALSVVFTYSISTAFATTEYTLDDYATALNAEKTAQLGYLASAKAQAASSYTYNDDGFTTVSGSSLHYSKAAIEAAADAVIGDRTDAMDAVISAKLNKAGAYPTPTAPDKSLVRINDSVLSGAGMKTALELKKDELAKAQLPLTIAFVNGKLAVDYTKYNSTDKDYTVGSVKVTAAQKVQYLVDQANSSIAAISTSATDTQKVQGYEDAYDAFDLAMKSVKTLVDEEFDNSQNASDIDDAISMVLYNTKEAVNNAFDAGKFDPSSVNHVKDMESDTTVDLTQQVASGAALEVFWDASATSATKGTLFGVDVPNLTKVTRTQMMAIQNAASSAIAAEKAPLKAYGTTVEKIDDIATNHKELVTLKNSMDVVDKYADVVKAGEGLKGSYVNGIKQYDDAKVEKAVKDAEKLVYADLASTLKTNAVDYIAAAAKDGKLSNLELENFEIQKFNKAVSDAKAKMYDSETGKPAERVPSGDDKTADADLVYLQGTYATSEASKWVKIADEAISNLNDAENYDEITKAMESAATEFGKLLKKDDETKVISERNKYIAALGDYKTLRTGVMDSAKYDSATLDAAEADGVAKIEKANTVEAVKAAYEDAKTAMDNIKSKDELKDAKTAMEAKIAALPYTSKLTSADKAAVKAVFDEYVNYKDIPGTADATNYASLKEKYNKVIDLAVADVKAKAKELDKKLPTTQSDADTVALLAMKDDVNALLAEGKALVKEVEDAIDDAPSNVAPELISANDFGTEYENLAKVNFLSASVRNANTLLYKASNVGATAADKKAALDAYNNLSDKAKYMVDASYITFVKNLQNEFNKDVEAVKVKASSKAVRGSITVKWTVSEKVDGVKYQVWKSTKQSSGYKKMITTSKTSYKNTKGLKKGTRYYYKVRAIKVVDGKTYYGDFSNKAYRVAK